MGRMRNFFKKKCPQNKQQQITLNGCLRNTTTTNTANISDINSNDDGNHLIENHNSNDGDVNHTIINDINSSSSSSRKKRTRKKSTTTINLNKLNQHYNDESITETIPTTITKEPMITSPIINVDGDNYNEEKEEEWQKVLYKHQGVPDNYVPKTFLKDLRKNVNLRHFHLMEVIIAASFVTQQIILIVILVLMFIYFDYYQNQYDPILFLVIAVVTLFLYSLILFTSKFQEIIQIQSCLIFLIACFTMSPILKTLTETISTDTIYAQCTIMAIIHLAFNDYGLDAAIVSRPISLNAIFFASVCLASRLSTVYHAFAFLIFSTDLFVLINLMYKSLKIPNKLLVTALFTTITTFLIGFTFGFISFLISIIFVLLINFFCPYVFIRMQSLKENIYGPWDEAIIDQSKLEFSKKNLSPKLSGEKFEEWNGSCNQSTMFNRGNSATDKIPPPSSLSPSHQDLNFENLLLSSSMNHNNSNNNIKNRNIPFN